MQLEAFLTELSNIRPNSTFLTLHRYRNEAGELSDFNILFHISYRNALKKSVEIIEALTDKGATQRQAREAVLASYKKSLEKFDVDGNESEEEKMTDSTYITFVDPATGKAVKGVKLHRESGIAHLFGFAHMKRVIEAGVYKEVNSSDLTIEKNAIRKLCPVSKFRQFKLVAEKVERVKVQGISLLPPDPLW